MLPPLVTDLLPAPSGERTNEDLATQVARVTQLDHEMLERIRHEVLTAAVPWTAEYGPYQSGGWWTASLLNESGADDDVTIRDCDPVATPLLGRLPTTARLLAGLDLPLMWVRLAKLTPNSFLWEHRDYADLRRTPRQRLHVPLFTNRSAALVTGGARINLTVGHLWRLRPTYAHGACNLLGPDRLHLIIDIYEGDVDGGWLEPEDIEHLPQPTEEELRRCLAEARTLAELGFVRPAEKYLLRLFYRRSMAEGQVYEMIVELHRELGRQHDADHWSGLRDTLLDMAGFAAGDGGSR